MQLFKPKWRVLQKTKGDGKEVFVAQYRRFFIWRNFVKYKGSRYNSEHQSLEDANNFLYRIHMKEKSKLIVNKKTHPFDEVFHKLKKD